MNALDRVEILSEHIELTNRKIQQEIKEYGNFNEIYDCACSIEEIVILIKEILENN